MKLLKEFKSKLDNENFDLNHEANMVQSRILSTINDVIDEKGYTQADLARLTGLKQPFISALMNVRRKLNMEHIALFQEALEIKLQPPNYLSKDDHFNAYFENDQYRTWNLRMSSNFFSKESCMKEFTNNVKIFGYGYASFPIDELKKEIKEEENDLELFACQI